MRYAILCVIALFAANAAAAQQSCVCTAGCKIAADSYPPGPAQPTSCAVYKGGVQIANAPVILSTSIPASNATVCAPPSPAYVGIAGGVSCEVPIPAQPPGAFTITMTASNAQGETLPSVAYTYISVSALPVLPAVPTNLRPN